MKTNLYEIFSYILFILCVSTVILLLGLTIYEKIYGAKTKTADDSLSIPAKSMKYGESIKTLSKELNPEPFTTGYVKNPPQKVADVCNSVMYPVHIDYSAINSTNINDLNKNKNNIINIFNSPP